MGLGDNLQLISYMAAAESFNQGANIFECFKPLIESTLICSAEKGSISFLALQKQLNDLFHLAAPKATVRYLLDKLQQEGLLDFVDRKTIVLSKIELNRTFWDKRAEREAAIEDFFLEFNNFLIKKGIQISILEIKEQSCKWLYTHSLELASFVSRGKLEIKKCSESCDSWHYVDQLIEFLLEIQIQKSAHFETFVQLYNGAVQASLLNFEPDQISEISEKNFQISNVILDTNFILRMLNLQSEYDVSVALETIECLKATGSHFYILEQTIDEITNSIKGFLNDIQPYAAQTRAYLQGSRIRMTGFWDAYRRGVARTDFLYLMNRENLKQALRRSIDVTFVEDFDDSVIPKEKIDALVVSKSKDGYYEKQARHDLALIEYCKKNRKKKLSDITEANWWVLTNDERLTYWNQANNGVYQECITETQLSNLIWLQKKKTDNCGLMQTIVTLSSNTAVTPQGIYAFAARVHNYQQSHSNCTKDMDKLSIVFASNVLTSEDIKRISSAEEEFDRVIEAKVIQCSIDADDKQKQLADAAEENTKLFSEVAKLKAQLDEERTIRQQEAYKRNIHDALNEIKTQEETLNSYKKITNFISQNEKSNNRILCLLIFAPIVMIIFSYIRAGFPYIADFLQEISQLSSIMQNILSALFIPALTFLYYIAVMLIFGKRPIAPEKLYDLLYQKLLDYRLQLFAQKESIPSKYLGSNVENDILLAEQEIRTLNHRIDSWSREIKSLEMASV